MTNAVDVNVVSSNRVQISIVAGASGDQGPVLGVIERADGGGAYAVVPVGTKLVLTDFIVSVGVPNDPVIGDNDGFLGNISRAAVGSECAPRRSGACSSGSSGATRSLPASRPGLNTTPASGCVSRRERKAGPPGTLA